MEFEEKLSTMGIEVPQLDPSYDVATYGRMIPHFTVGNVLTLTAVPELEGEIFYPGRVGESVSTEDGYRAARLAGTHLLGGLKLALGDLDRVKRLLQTVNFVACAPDFAEVHGVASGLTDLLAAVYGEQRGVGVRVAVGVQRLAREICFETWAQFEIHEP